MRRKRGQEPLRYVSWLTPPSYRQSEAQRRRNAVPVADYVPPYTEEANENDLGYYDAEGVFHVNSKAQPPPSPSDAYLPEHRIDREVDLEMQRPEYLSSMPGEYPMEQVTTALPHNHEAVVNDNSFPSSTTTEDPNQNSMRQAMTDAARLN